MSRAWLLIFLFVTISWQGIAQQQFYEQFKQVKLHLANHKEDLAIPILEDLLINNPENANIAYLLGYCYVKQEKEIDRAIKLLEIASESFSQDYDPTSLDETSVSEYVYYYLIIAYSLDGQCGKAKNTLNKFYQIYSYYDEWYLVEGQKWLRECGQHEWDRLKQDSIAQADSLLAIDQSVSTGKLQGVKLNEELLEESTIPDSAILPKTDQPEGGQFKDRLLLVEKDEETGTYRPKPIDPEERNIVTKTINYTTASILYGVQVAAYIEPKFTRDFANVKNVEVYMDNNGVFRYVIGRFPYRQQAEKLLEWVKKAGYTDAFIVDINGDKYSEEVVSVDDESIKREIKGKVDFRVQIGAFKREIPEHVARQYLMIDKIKETKVGDYTVLTIGSFDSYERAAEFRNKLQTIGVADAFIVAFNYDKKIPLDEAEAFLKQQKLNEIREKAKHGKKRRKDRKEEEKEDQLPSVDEG